MSNYKKLLVLFLGLLFLSASTAGAVPFVPEQSTLSPLELKQGENGYFVTVIKGTEPTRIPIRIESVVPQQGRIKNLIMVRILGSHELAAGMSGSPVYVRGKLVGAIRSGWNFSDHKLALATPISEMCGIFDFVPEKKPEKKQPKGNEKEKEGQELVLVPEEPETDSKLEPKEKHEKQENEQDKKNVKLAEPLAISGLSQASAESLARSLGTNLAESPAAAVSRELLVEQETELKSKKLRPGDAVSALLAWGDVTAGATGTVSATAKDGRFLAFAHSFMRRGNTNYPAARAWIHETVSAQTFPFKIASPVSLIGAITQDREAGIGGQTGFFPPSIAATMTFRDLDLGTREERKFRVIVDQNFTAKLLDGIYTGLLDDAWGRTGAGTMAVTLRIDGKELENGWTRKDIFYSDTNISAIALKQAVNIMNAFLTQPFENNMPLGFHIDVEATSEAKAILIENVEAPEKAAAGSEITVTVTLRPWRSQPIKRDFTLVIPKDASGICELTVRGGGSHPMAQLAIEGGWKSIDSQARMLEEIRALDANNELVLELQSDSITAALKKSKQAKTNSSNKNSNDNLLPEEQEFLSETKERRIKEGTLRIFRSDSFVDGLMRRLITVEPLTESEQEKK